MYESVMILKKTHIFTNLPIHTERERAKDTGIIVTGESDPVSAYPSSPYPLNFVSQ